MITYPEILQVIESFYDIAKKDVMIGYHFRFIEDFDTHIPRIADFWNLQLTGNMQDRSHLPFELFAKHAPLKINRGEIGRWVKLFKDNLAEAKLSAEMKTQWEEKVDFFASKIDQHFFG